MKFLKIILPLLLFLAGAFTANSHADMKLFGNKKNTEKEVKLHPENKKAIQLVFETDGEKFYRFKSVADLPQVRQAMALQFLNESGQVMSSELLSACLDNLVESVQNKKLEQFYYQIGIMRDMAKSMTYLDAFYHAASATTFTLEDNINDYDELIARSHIDKFKKLDQTFFLRTLSKNFPSMQMQLPTDLTATLNLQKVRMQAYNTALKSIGVELPNYSEALKNIGGQKRTSKHTKTSSIGQEAHDLNLKS